VQPDGFGSRARIGLIYIASSIVMEPECYAMAPPEVSFHTTRIPLGQVTVENLNNLATDEVDQLVDATRLLAMAPLHSIVFACTSGSFIGGRGYDDAILARMSEVSGGIPVTTTTTAVVKALHALDVRRVVVAAPYTRSVTDRAVSYLAQHDFEVLDSGCMNLDDDVEIGFTPPKKVEALVRKLDRPNAEAIFISCTNLRTVGILEDLEKSLNKPVISAIQASFWDGLRLAGIRAPIMRYGLLLRI
jgi:maleate isomerase